MANATMNTDFVDKAIKFAVDAHHGTERRGKGYPYVIHCLEAVEIVASMSSDPELLAAAALHDTVEDCGVSFEELEREFGAKVAQLVKVETDADVAAEDECASWRDRKKLGIDRISNATREEKIVALGDKLSNMRAIWRDSQVHGDKLWSIFHAPGGKSDHKWRYFELIDAFKELEDTFAYKEFVYLVEKVFG